MNTERQSNSEQRVAQAKALIEAGEHERARITLLEVIQAEPNNTAALMMLSGEYFSAGQYLEAEMVFERLQQELPKSGAISIGLFNTLMKLGRHEEAISEIRRFMLVADKYQERETLEQYAAISKAIAEAALNTQAT